MRLGDLESVSRENVVAIICNVNISYHVTTVRGIIQISRTCLLKYTSTEEHSSKGKIGQACRWLQRDRFC